MSENGAATENLSPRRVVGFACNQGFVFFLFYMGANVSMAFQGAQIERIDLLFMLVFMGIGFGVLSGVPDRHRNMILSRPALILFSLVMALASLYSLLPSHSPALMLCASALVGVAASYLLTAWGRAFVAVPTETATLEVFAGSLAAVALCLLFSLSDAPGVMVLMRALPVASALWIEIPRANAHLSSSGPFTSDKVASLSLKILMGTLCLGAAAGFMETYSTQPGMMVSPYFRTGMVIFAAFLIGSLTLMPAGGLGKGGALNKAYRLAVFVMLLGALIVPLTDDSTLLGGALVLAGYLGLEAVLISLFLISARISPIDGVAVFVTGFLALFSGEAVGIAISNAMTMATGTMQTPYAVVVVSGALVMLSYVFLFTERDFDVLSQIVVESDSFERASLLLARQSNLSKRESEILPFALRGRTSARIAEELGISKSTVDTHLRRIYAKANVHGRQELIDLVESMKSAGRV